MSRPLTYVFCAAAVLSGCDDDRAVVQPPSRPLPTEAEPVVMDWKAEQLRRQEGHASYLEDRREAYEWFTSAPFSTQQGIPYLILKLLPEVAPDIWGDDALTTVGLFYDDRRGDSPLPRGWGWSGMTRSPDEEAVDVTSTSCGSCHLGRVRVAPGEYRYIDGGISAQFNLVDFRVKLQQTVDLLVNDGKEGAPIDKVEQAFLAALDKAVENGPTHFYNDYSFLDRRFDAAYEAKQIALFRAQSKELVQSFVTRTSQKARAFHALVDTNYPTFKEQMLRGIPGMADAAGVNRSFTHILRKDAGVPVNPKLEMPADQSIVDFMAVWAQDRRSGGQWNGNIPTPVYRNLAAELTLGFTAQTDIRIAVFSRELLGQLPAPVYPFDVETKPAAKGKELFEENCAGCHKPNNSAVYNVGTDMSRAFNTTDESVARAQVGFVQFCGPDTVVTMPSGDDVKPCPETAPENVFRPNSETAGYQASALDGIWAQAPYLHGGTVPTLYHLLVPDERPHQFFRGRLDYDQELGGFAWATSGTDDDGNAEGTLFHVRGDIPVFTVAGHDADIVKDGVTYKLNWSDDKEGARALVEYMKTL